MAVQSVLQQTFGDFELVISNGGSTDNTREVVQQFNDSRIKYLESAERLSIADNYQAGLEHATGEYITFLSDDDAYTPNLLKRVDELFAETKGDIVGYRFCRYYHEDLYDLERKIPRNSLLIPKFDGDVTRFSGHEALDQIMAMHALSSTTVNPRFICPLLANATYRRNIFDSLRNKRKNLFDMVPADIYLAAAVFYQADSYYCLDEPLLVWSNWEGNSTATPQRTGDKLSDHYKGLLGGRSLENTPLKFPFPLNCGANAVVEAVHENDPGEASIDWSSYFYSIHKYLINLKSLGIDTTAEERELKDALGHLPPEIRRNVDEKFSGIAIKTRALLSSQMPSALALLRKFRYRSQNTMISGSSAGFDNVVEAASYVN